MIYRVEYQYAHWRGRGEKGCDRWWIESERTFKSKSARTKFINKMNDKYEFIDFKPKGEEILEDPEPDTTLEKDLKMNKKTVVIYTDGSAHYKDKMGGLGVYIKFGTGSNIKEKIISKGYSNTTNNRMELRAVIEAMKAIKLKDY